MKLFICLSKQNKSKVNNEQMLFRHDDSLWLSSLWLFVTLTSHSCRWIDLNDFQLYIIVCILSYGKQLKSSCHLHRLCVIWSTAGTKQQSADSSPACFCARSALQLKKRKREILDSLHSSLCPRVDPSGQPTDRPTDQPTDWEIEPLVLLYFVNLHFLCLER